MKLVITSLIFIFLQLGYSQVVSVQDGDWSDAATWGSGRIRNNSDVIIAHNVNIDVDDRCRSLQINSSGTLNNNGFELRVDRSWTNSGSYVDTLGTILFQSFFGGHTLSGNTDFNNVTISFKTINLASSITIRGVLELGFLSNLNISTGSMTLIASNSYHGRLGTVSLGAINGTFTSERYVGRCDGWSWYAGPFDASLSDFASASGGNMVYTGIPGSIAPTFSFVNAYFYNEDWNNVGFTGYVVPSGVSDVVTRGTGFWYWNSDTVFLSGQNFIPQMWKMSLSGSIDLNTAFDFNLNFTDNANAANDGWNFLGNPYPGTIDWDADAWTSTGLDGALYMFNTCGESYSSYVGGIGTNGGTNIIPSYQGFHVKANLAAPTLSVTSGALVNADADLKTTNLLENVLRVQLDGDEIILRANDNASVVFDNGMDALKFSADYERLYTKNYGEDPNYSINSVNDSTAHIPLFTKGNGTLSFADVITWEGHYILTLEDLETGQMYPIQSGFEFQFSSTDSLNFINRFVIHLFGGSELGIDELENNKLQVLYDKSEMLIKSDYLNQMVNLELVNMMGQVIFSKRVLINKEGYRMKRPDQMMILRVSETNLLKSIKVF